MLCPYCPYFLYIISIYTHMRACTRAQMRAHRDGTRAGKFRNTMSGTWTYGQSRPLKRSALVVYSLLRQLWIWNPDRAGLACDRIFGPCLNPSEIAQDRCNSHDFASCLPIFGDCERTVIA